ncbi:hypothetical protein HHI36_003111 [Cryptolaemus montrouzieri]|uniref:Uncharacterized protein n=1 Tax=Cryptolaemus montrouzieri TaxID=559131 RepID=A0ABD2PCI1_9CUCU
MKAKLIDDFLQLYRHQYNITSFSGCIEKAAFANTTLTEVHIRQQQSVTNIREDEVRNMDRLRSFVVWGCPIEQISVGAFSNIPKLQNLQVAYGNLKTIGNNIFNAVPSIQKIFLDNNVLKQWENSWFANTSNLEIIDFQSNKLEIIPSRAFYGMAHLKQLFLDYNEIKMIGPEAFKGIRHLDYLGLRYNRLLDLDESIFPNDLSVRSLLIDANYLNYLANELLKKLSVKDLTLDGNPWKCPYLDRIHYWLFVKNATLRTSNSCTGSNIPLCLYPETYSQTCLENIDDQITRSYLDGLRRLKEPLDKFCARLD